MSTSPTDFFKSPQQPDNLNTPSFMDACLKIESDPNYRSGIDERQLLALVRNEDGGAKHIPRKSALAIIPFETKHALVKAYQITIAKKGAVGDEEIPHWHVDDSTCIVVSQKGEYLFYKTEDVEQEKFAAPLTHLNIGQFLNQECLHNSKLEVSSIPQMK